MERVEALSLRSEVAPADFELDGQTSVAVLGTGGSEQVLPEGGLASPPTTTASEEPARSLRDVTDDELFERLASVPLTDALDPVSREAIRRLLEVRSFGVNDPRWLGPDGLPSSGALKVLRALLQQGYWLPPP